MKTTIPLMTKVERNGDSSLLPAQRLNFVDKAITFFAPNYGVRAMVARQTLHEFGYNDSPTSRGKTPPLRGSETWTANRDRLKAMAEARDAAQYDWIGGVLAKVVLYVCGRLHCKSATGDEAVDEAYDACLHGWCGDERDENGRTRCDISGRHRFLKQVQMALLAFLVDGDHGLLEVEPVYDPATGMPTREFCLQNIEADRIGSPNDSVTDENYIGGVILNPEFGTIDGYRVFHRTRTNQYTGAEDVPAPSFIHVFDPDRSDEYRGRTKLLRLLNDLRDIRETIEAEKIAGKIQSQFAAMFTSKDPFKNTGPDAWTGQTKEGTPTQDAMWGKILKMGEGETVNMMAPSSRPTGAAMALWEMLIRKMSVSLNLPFGFLWNLATLGGVTARIEVQGALRQIQYWQDNVLKALILDRVRQKVLAQGFIQRTIPFHPNWKKCEWHFGPWITTDAGYEMDNDIAGVATGILPISDITGKYGYTPREVFVSNASAANAAIGVGAEHELPVEVFAKGLWPDITNQKAAYLAPTPLPPPPPGSLEAIGEKGVAQLIEILEKVGDGTLDRESAKHTLKTIFHISPAVAEKIIPEQGEKESEANKTMLEELKSQVIQLSADSSTDKETALKEVIEGLAARLDRQAIVVSPEIKMAARPADVTNIHVAAAEAAPAPDVIVNVPEQKAPIVNVAPSSVEVHPTFELAAPSVKVESPIVNLHMEPEIKLNAPVQDKQEQRVTRDRAGNITGSVTKITYKKTPIKKRRRPIK